MTESVISRIPPCSTCDIERLESWLTDMAWEGWHLTPEGADQPMGRGKFWPVWFFRRGEPREVPYRLVPGREESNRGDMAVMGGDRLEFDPSEETVEDLAVRGWEYVDRFSHFYIYRGAEGFDGSFRLDPPVRPAQLALARKWEWWSSLVPILLVAIGLPLFLYLSVGLTLWAVLLSLSFLAVKIPRMVIRVGHLKRLQRTLETGGCLNHSKPWRETAKRAESLGKLCRVFDILWLICFALVIYFDIS